MENQIKEYKKDLEVENLDGNILNTEDFVSLESYRIQPLKKEGYRKV